MQFSIGMKLIKLILFLMYKITKKVKTKAEVLLSLIVTVKLT